MNKKFLLTLLSSQIVFGSVMSMVMMTKPAHADPTINQAGNHNACVEHPHVATHKLVCIKASNTANRVPNQQVGVASSQPNQIAELKFSDQESDEAIKLFGCDCPRCINAVRALHGLAPIPV
ncbi:hypothetical protein G7B40_018295 [Aetokthonos hydrillicola Thurmond2011]|jgi:hypothetical protein|uniref:Uncharacterized protein n=1 Tax=Aetokthonos hydrillicola Thurmond2011 TaxID=2712845 RepID=A0AAP5M8R1_9CYAN|nr:hypothetical protein [Aetokthonos hydrillicola]MBO3460349.1 hypothetical protein [Aetokthonos hydrillicola CCALA 1050]MBW4588385.1 hypothetical protein [Aetokthonos hydrillicola CCALA 1050]MDR9896495.1 hypothetical protein [Aetokthonos hydrillicola Thurmond2011]